MDLFTIYILLFPTCCFAHTILHVVHYDSYVVAPVGHTFAHFRHYSLRLIVNGNQSGLPAGFISRVGPPSLLPIFKYHVSNQYKYERSPASINIVIDFSFSSAPVSFPLHSQTPQLCHPQLSCANRVTLLLRSAL